MDVNTMMEKMRKKAEETNIKFSMAIVDSGGHLLEFHRMDGAQIGTIDVSIKKAKTSAYFSTETEAFMELAKPEGPFYGMEILNGGLVVFGGGIPILENGRLIGAIGVSGGTAQEDIAVAKSALENTK